MKHVHIVLLAALMCSGCQYLTRPRYDLPADLSPLVAKLEHPKVCLALSGGGLRSAAFSTGVMRGLATKNALGQIDIISAASGGSWSLLWLNARLSETPDSSVESVFGIGSDTTSGDLVTLDSSSFIDPFWKGWTAFWGLFRAADAAYYGALFGKFNFLPLSRNALISNVLVKKQPVPVVVVSRIPECYGAGEGNVYDMSGPSMKDQLTDLLPINDHLVELTPVNWGSRNTSYTQTFEYPIGDVTNWPTISGAFIDAPGYRRCATMRLLGEKFGSHITSPETMDKAWNKRESIYVADGGFADNLAVRNLVDRQCKTILVVDAEHDPALEFGSYRRLRCDLNNTVHDRMVVPTIDRWLADSQACEASEQRAAFLADDAQNPIVQQPITEGCITKGADCTNLSTDIKLFYLKLTLNPGQLQDLTSNGYDDVVAAYEKRHSEVCTLRSKSGDDNECSFPQTPTTKSNYDADEFRAYRHLGEYMIEAYLPVNEYLSVH